MQDLNNFIATMVGAQRLEVRQHKGQSWWTTIINPYNQTPAELAARTKAAGFADAFAMTDNDPANVLDFPRVYLRPVLDSDGPAPASENYVVEKADHPQLHTLSSKLQEAENIKVDGIAGMNYLLERRQEIERTLAGLRSKADLWSSLISWATYYGISLTGMRTDVALIKAVLDAGEARASQTMLVREHDRISEAMGLPVLPDQVRPMPWPPAGYEPGTMPKEPQIESVGGGEVIGPFHSSAAEMWAEMERMGSDFASMVVADQETGQPMKLAIWQLGENCYEVLRHEQDQAAAREVPNRLRPIVKYLEEIADKLAQTLIDREPISRLDWIHDEIIRCINTLDSSGDMPNERPGRNVTEIERDAILTVAEIAEIFGLKPMKLGATDRYTGANPIEAGAAKNGFILFANGHAYDRTLRKEYSAIEVEKHALKMREEKPAQESETWLKLSDAAPPLVGMYWVQDYALNTWRHYWDWQKGFSGEKANQIIYWRVGRISVK